MNNICTGRRHKNKPQLVLHCNAIMVSRNHCALFIWVFFFLHFVRAIYIRRLCVRVSSCVSSVAGPNRMKWPMRRKSKEMARHVFDCVANSPHSTQFGRYNSQYVTRKQDIIYVHPIIFYFEPQKLINCLILLLVYVFVVVAPLSPVNPRQHKNVPNYGFFFAAIFVVVGGAACCWNWIREFSDFNLMFFSFRRLHRHCPDRRHSQKS